MKESNLNLAFATKREILALLEARDQVEKGRWSFVKIGNIRNRPAVRFLAALSEASLQQSAREALLTEIDMRIEILHKQLSGLGIELDLLGNLEERKVLQIEEPEFEEEPPVQISRARAARIRESVGNGK